MRLYYILVIVKLIFCTCILRILGRTARVNNLEGQENQRLRAFRSAYPDAHSAFDWYKGNKNRFKGEIHPPIMLCVS